MYVCVHTRAIVCVCTHMLQCVWRSQFWGVSSRLPLCDGTQDVRLGGKLWYLRSRESASWPQELTMFKC